MRCRELAVVDVCLHGKTGSQRYDAYFSGNLSAVQPPSGTYGIDFLLADFGKAANPAAFRQAVFAGIRQLSCILVVYTNL